MASNAFAETRYFKQFETEFFDHQNKGIGIVSGDITFVMDDDRSMKLPIFKKGEMLHFGFYHGSKSEECAAQIKEHEDMVHVFDSDQSIRKDSDGNYYPAGKKMSFICTAAMYRVMVEPLQYVTKDNTVIGYKFNVQYFNGTEYIGRIQTPLMKLSEPYLGTY